MRKINPIDQSSIEFESGKMKIQNDNATGFIKGGKDSGEIKVVSWQLCHQHMKLSPCNFMPCMI